MNNMKTSRREFIKNGTLTIAGASLFSKQLFAYNAAKELVGVQLYSVRDEMKVDPMSTLRMIADIGYKNVEHAGYADRKFYGYTASDFKKVLDDLGMKMPSGHTVLGLQHWDAKSKSFTDEWKTTLEDAATAGQQYVISPWLDESLRTKYDDLLHFLDLFNKCGELCKKSGLKFGYHNHDFEFQNSLNGKKIYDIILDHTDPALVTHQLDIGNMYGAGGRAAEVIKRHPGRFESMHVKDEIKAGDKGELGNGYESTILGKGLVPVKEIIDAGRKTGGTKLFIIEQESYQGKTPIESVKEDLKIMKDWGYQ
jgi:sugar phosphate isomerase/epimerase